MASSRACTSSIRVVRHIIIAIVVAIVISIFICSHASNRQQLCIQHQEDAFELTADGCCQRPHGLLQARKWFFRRCRPWFLSRSCTIILRVHDGCKEVCPFTKRDRRLTEAWFSQLEGVTTARSRAVISTAGLEARGCDGSTWELGSKVLLRPCSSGETKGSFGAVSPGGIEAKRKSQVRARSAGLICCCCRCTSKGIVGSHLKTSISSAWDRYAV